VPIAFLWQRDQPQLLQDMLSADIDAVLVKVASMGLRPRMLGRTLRELLPALRKTSSEAGLNICGEGGEYESLVLRCPLFRPGCGVRIDRAETVTVSDDAFAPVAHLTVHACSVATDAPPTDPSPPAALRFGFDSRTRRRQAPTPAPIKVAPPPSEEEEEEGRRLDANQSSGPAAQAQAPYSSNVAAAAAILPTSGLHSECQCSASAPLERAECAAQQVTRILSSLAQGPGGAVSLSDVAFAHLYLTDMALFEPVNGAYCRFFGAHPPSRSCVAVARFPAAAAAAVAAAAATSPHGALVLLDVLALRGCGTVRRTTLHVSSLSRWAPLCIGPYSQANVLGDTLVLCAGQIGLDPASMQMVALPSAQPLAQLRRALLNAARITGALASSLTSSLAVTLYVNSRLMKSPLLLRILRAVAALWLSGRIGPDGYGEQAEEGFNNDTDRDDCDSSDPEDADEERLRAHEYSQAGDAGTGSGAVWEGPGSADDPCELRDFVLPFAAFDCPPKGLFAGTGLDRNGSAPKNRPLRSVSGMVRDGESFCASTAVLLGEEAPSAKLMRSLELIERTVLPWLPLHTVVMPMLPRDADVEVEVQSLTSHALDLAIPLDSSAVSPAMEVVDRPEPTEVPVQTKVHILKTNTDQLCVSIACLAGMDPSTTGVSTLATACSAHLAAEMQSIVRKVALNTEAYAKISWYARIYATGSILTSVPSIWLGSIAPAICDALQSTVAATFVESSSLPFDTDSFGGDNAGRILVHLQGLRL
jgi:enamine deaminase RidA (YjgF/YER057c/UK114 family)